MNLLCSSWHALSLRRQWAQMGMNTMSATVRRIFMLGLSMSGALTPDASPPAGTRGFRKGWAHGSSLFLIGVVPNVRSRCAAPPHTSAAAGWDDDTSGQLRPLFSIFVLASVAASCILRPAGRFCSGHCDIFQSPWPVVLPGAVHDRTRFGTAVDARRLV
jgi:hypothetical protein